MPSPPFCFSQHTCPQETKWNFQLVSYEPAQMSLPLIRFIIRRTTVIKTKDMEYKGVADKIAFNKIILPPKDSILPLHPSNFLCIESRSGDQSILFSWVGFISIPKYVKENVFCLQLRSLVMNEFNLPIAIRELLWKLIFNLDQTSKYRRTHLITIASLMSFCPNIKVFLAYCKLTNATTEEPNKPSISCSQWKFLSK